MRTYLLLLASILLLGVGCSREEVHGPATSTGPVNINEISDPSKVHLLYFTAAWCGPCKTQKPIIHQLKSQFPNIAFHTIDIDQNPDLARTYNVESIPRTIILAQGDTREQMVGVQSYDKLAMLLKQYSQ